MTIKLKKTSWIFFNTKKLKPKDQERKLKNEKNED